MKHVIIGGVAGGATAAARIRRADEKARIILIEKGPYISYANCGLPYYIGGVIQDRERLFVQTPEAFGKRFAIDVRTRNEVIGIDPEKKEISVKDKQGRTYIESYDRLLLSPGADPVRPPLPGIDSEGIFCLRNVQDTDNIKAYLKTHSVKRAVIVGAGFIGLEMAENLHTAGAEVEIVEMAPQVMSPLDFSIASLVHQQLLQQGVILHLGKSVSGFERKNGSIEVKLKSGETIPADIVLLSIGVRPKTELARQAGLEIGETGGIKVDEYLRTSQPDIYAVGDAIQYTHPLTGQPWLNFLANPANRQGRIVADNMVFGNRNTYEGAIGTSIAKVFDLSVAATGLPAKKLKQLGIPYASSTTHSSSSAGYYPGAMPMTLKLTFDPHSGKIYGGQAVGCNGVDKRIDQIALLIKQGGTIEDLLRLEHAYAPPFSSAKDPAAIAGYVARNILDGSMPVIYWRDIDQARQNGSLLIDVRTPEEFSLGSIPGALNYPLDSLREHLDELPKDREIITFCAIGLRGYLALRILTGNGFKTRNLSGGYKTYASAKAPTGFPMPSLPNTGINLETQRQESPLSDTRPEPPVRIDACGLQCPGPILKVKQCIDQMEPGQIVEITATDAGFPRDAAAWCKTTGNDLLENKTEKGHYTVKIRKSVKKDCHLVNSCEGKAQTLIMFSDDLDKALATFVLANGAAATGQKVSIFFTFWGLNVIKKEHKPAVKKDLFGKMFGMMLPGNSKKLHLSKMSMLGIGDKMMRRIMKKKNIDSLESLRQQALDNGVEFIACQMSMDVMGVKKEELLDRVVVGGVASYMERAENANVNLFI